MTATATTACILPADGQAPIDSFDYAPVIDLASIVPSEQVFDVSVPEAQGGSCIFSMSARLSDHDDKSVRIRWVADNKSSTVYLLKSDEDFTIPEGSKLASIEVNTRLITPPLVGAPHSITLFVTDASAWDATEEEIRRFDKTDAGKIPTPSDGGTVRGVVVAVSWFINFTEGECR